MQEGKDNHMKLKNNYADMMKVKDSEERTRIYLYKESIREGIKRTREDKFIANRTKREEIKS